MAKIRASPTRISCRWLDFPGAADDVDRLRAASLGLTAARRRHQHADLAVLELARRADLFPQPDKRVNYIVACKMPIVQVDYGPVAHGNPGDAPRRHPNQPRPTVSLSALSAAPVIRLADIATVYPRSSIESINHYTVQRVHRVNANVDGRDLGGVAGDIQS